MEPRPTPSMAETSKPEPTIESALQSLNYVIEALTPYAISPVLGDLVLRLINTRTFLVTDGEQRDQLLGQLEEMKGALDSIKHLMDSLPKDATADTIRKKLADILK